MCCPTNCAAAIVASTMPTDRALVRLCAWLRSRHRWMVDSTSGKVARGSVFAVMTGVPSPLFSSGKYDKVRVSLSDQGKLLNALASKKRGSSEHLAPVVRKNLALGLKVFVGGVTRQAFELANVAQGDAAPIEALDHPGGLQPVQLSAH